MSQMSRQLTPGTKDIKQELKKNSQGRQRSKTTLPVKVLVSPVSHIGNTANRFKMEPTTSSSMLETTGRSQDQRSRTLERTLSASKRSCSLQRDQSPAPSAHHYNSYSETLTGRLEYVSASPLRPQISNSSTSSSAFGPESRRYQKHGTMLADSSASIRGISGVGAESNWSPSSVDSNSCKTDTTVSEFKSRRADPSDTTGRSNDRQSNGRQSRAADRNGASRLRSASQGLRNLGNTCYMNSIVQCLAKVPWFNGASMRSSKCHDDLLNEFFILMKKMQENESDRPIDPFQFRTQISSLGFRFSSSDQNDAHEFLLCLLSRLSKTLKSVQEPDLVKEFLWGTQQNVIRFKECRHVLNNDQPFFSVSLPVNLNSGESWLRSTPVDLSKCLESYTKEEDVEGKALCMECDHTQLCSMETSFKHLPKFLIIHLKRFDFLRAEKLENDVSFPLKGLKITQKDRDQHGKVTADKAISYDLIALCNHYGSLRFGHYTADIKSPSDNWYNYSDSRVTQSHTIGKYGSSLTSRDASILFYKRSDRI